MDPKIVREVLDLKLHNQRKRNQSQHLAKVVLTAEEANSIFEEFHCSQFGGHCGLEKTHRAIISCYCWPGMEEDIRKWVAQCCQCQSKRAHIK
ncbi:hypothetical protein PFLUV_G00139920 [Perca fluviatilis]|uniref:Gypsy retrotransposon integrase-like protein 1 n=1 Tax=Perca fluviatilis TaxID=8168 RepID=A0A6A5F1Q3_PERFL|nr:hypothetical protein PFLUV_G00139920 [Perca fluviatilis]